MLKRLSPYFPILLLFVLAPFIGEVLSTSTPLIAFVNPWTLFWLGGLYGAGAILARELTVRWGKGWLTILLLGIAYGIIEEGLAVKSFFDPNWQDLGSLAGYDRWLGVNWVWVVHLTLFHMVYSITIPILLTELTFPAYRGRAWTGKWVFRALAALFVLTVALFFTITDNSPPPIPYIIAFCVVVALIMMSRSLPKALPPIKANVPVPLRFFVAGFVIALVWFFSVWLFPDWGIAPSVLIAALLAWAIISAGWILRVTGNGSAWNQKHQLALVSGFLGFLMFLSPVAGVIICPYLLWLWFRLQPSAQSASSARKTRGTSRR